jgi:hypothetical protein
VDGILTEDSDAFLYGGKVIYKDLKPYNRASFTILILCAQVFNSWYVKVPVFYLICLQCYKFGEYIPQHIVFGMLMGTHCVSLSTSLTLVLL